MLELSLPESTIGVVKLKWPQEVGGLLEVGSDGVDLMDEIFHTDHAVLAEILLNNLVVGQGKSLLVHLAIATLWSTMLVLTWVVD